jgi:hypothetical protein
VLDDGVSSMNDVSDDGRSAMRKLMTATAFLILAGGSIAVAQTSGRNGDATKGTSQNSPGSGATVEAPIGHKQPRASDVPSDDGSKPNAEDLALDRRLKSICRGC